MTATINDIPVYEAQIVDSECGMQRVSFVDFPAVESNFIAFDENKTTIKYAIANEEKRIVRGVLMRANFPIYRSDAHLGEYYIVYTAATIRQMVEKFLLDNNQNNVNIMHLSMSDVDGVYLNQIFIKDTAEGISPAGFENIEDGSLFGEYHVHNEDVWQRIKDGSFKGFSLEGIFSLEPKNADTQSFNKIISKKSMAIDLTKLKARLAKMLQELGAATTDKGVLYWDGDEDLRAGIDVWVDENRTRAEDGDYTTEDGKIIKVVDGKVSEIVDPRAEVDADEVIVETPDERPREDEERGREIGELRERIDAIEKRIEELATLIGDLVNAQERMATEMSAISKEPIAKPAHEEVKEDTSNRKAEAIMRIAEAMKRK